MTSTPTQDVVPGPVEGSDVISVRCPAGILKFCRLQSIVSERFHVETGPHWYPDVPWKSRLQARPVRLVGAHDWPRRLVRRGRKRPGEVESRCHA